MATLDPANNPVDQVRLYVSDIQEPYYLDNGTYQWLLSANNNDVVTASVKAAYIILGLLSKYTRERAGAIEVYGADAYKNYADFLKAFVRDPRTSMATAGMYAGGLSRKDIKENNANLDTVRRPTLQVLQPLLIPNPRGWNVSTFNPNLPVWI